MGLSAGKKAGPVPPIRFWTGPPGLELILPLRGRVNLMLAGLVA